MTRTSFTDTLLAEGPAADHRAALMTYGRFVGHWRTDTTEWLPGGATRSSVWDVRFTWVLEGRAIQDTWITPPPGETGPEGLRRYGTTLRLYEPATESWHIIWADGPSGRVTRQTGRLVGDDIVQLGEREFDGSWSRWVFRDIAEGSFRWCNEKSDDGAVTWWLVQQMLARRLA